MFEEYQKEKVTHPLVVGVTFGIAIVFNLVFFPLDPITISTVAAEGLLGIFAVSGTWCKYYQKS